MRASELIEELEDTIEFYGDLEVIVKDFAPVPDGPGKTVMDESISKIYSVDLTSQRYDRYIELKR